MTFERTSIDELEENGELSGVAVVHERHGSGEVVEQRSDMDEVFVEFGRAGVAEYVPVDDLKVDSEYYGGLKSSDAGFDFALERGLVPTRWEAALDGQGFEDPTGESPVEIPDGWFGGAVEQTGGFVLCRIWRTYEDRDDAREVEFEAIYGSERHVSIHRYAEDPDYGLTYDGEVETRVAEPNTDEEKARIARDMMEDFDREEALESDA